MKLFYIVFILIFSAKQISAQEIKVAVASNFSRAMKNIVSEYEKRSSYKVTIILGSTGKHYAQISNGAPYDIFLAADSLRPKLLEDNNFTVQNTRFTYAIGQLVLLSNKYDLENFQLNDFDKLSFNKLALANPKLAPYGCAAYDVLKHLNLVNAIRKKIVQGENVNQAYQFIISGNADIGFVSLSHVINTKRKNYFIIPSELYSPIKQQAVLLNKNIASIDFYNFLKSEKVKKIINEFGYISE